MRGKIAAGTRFSYISLEQRYARIIRCGDPHMVDKVLKELSPEFAKMYSK